MSKLLFSWSMEEFMQTSSVISQFWMEFITAPYGSPKRGTNQSKRTEPPPRIVVRVSGHGYTFTSTFLCTFYSRIARNKCQMNMMDLSKNGIYPRYPQKNHFWYLVNNHNYLVNNISHGIWRQPSSKHTQSDSTLSLLIQVHRCHWLLRRWNPQWRKDSGWLDLPIKKCVIYIYIIYIITIKYIFIINIHVYIVHLYKVWKKSRTGMLKCVHPSTCTSLQLSPLYTAQITMHIDPLPPCQQPEGQRIPGRTRTAATCRAVWRCEPAAIHSAGGKNLKKKTVNMWVCGLFCASHLPF